MPETDHARMDPRSAGHIRAGIGIPGCGRGTIALRPDSVLFQMGDRCCRSGRRPVAAQPVKPLLQLRGVEFAGEAEHDRAIAVDHGRGGHGRSHLEPVEVVAGRAGPDGKADLIALDELRDEQQGFWLSSSEAPTKRMPRAEYSRSMATSAGSSSLHGPHQVAQKFSTTSWPRSSRRLARLPFRSVKREFRPSARSSARRRRMEPTGL